MSVILTIDQGDVLRATATFTDPDDDSAVTPTAVYFQLLAPDSELTVYQYSVDSEATLVSTGVYRLTVAISQAGLYRVRVYSTGTGQAAEVGRVRALDNPMD